jgi:HEAT repeat protein
MQKLIEELEDKQHPERWQSVLALEKMGKPAVDYLVSALNDEDKWIRYTAADALGNIGDLKCVDNLIGLLSDQDQDVRFATADALGRLGDKKACNALNEMCQKDNGYVKVAALEALEKLSG